MDAPSAIWAASTSMGYGHLRAIHPFEGLAHGGVIDAANTHNTTPKEHAQWKRYQQLYETMSRARELPVVGKSAFGVLDKLLHIPPRYTSEDLSRPTFQVKMLYKQIGKGLGEGFVQTIREKPLPLLSSFYVSSIAADVAGINNVHTIICDADLNRVWVARDPKKSGIVYFAPCGAAAQRLRRYGVPERNIHISGFPLHESLLGSPGLEVLKHDLAIRLRMLDPTGRFSEAMQPSVDYFLGNYAHLPIPDDRKLTITYAVGGAGAQTNIGVAILQSLKQHILDGRVRLNLVAGTRVDVRDVFDEAHHKLLHGADGVNVVFRETTGEYFNAFNALMHTTDVLWTKPSELSFFTALGLPIIMAPKIGSQEKFNRRWLLEIGSGIRQERPLATIDWLYKLLERGTLAHMAWMGFLRARKRGTYVIADVLNGVEHHPSNNPLLR